MFGTESRHFKDSKKVKFQDLNHHIAWVMK